MLRTIIQMLQGKSPQIAAREDRMKKLEEHGWFPCKFWDTKIANPFWRLMDNFTLLWDLMRK